MAIALHYAARSDVGLVRQENQDSGYAGPHLLVVADGMGGHAAGDVASSIAIGEMVSLDGESPRADEALDLLAGALREANNQLRDAVERQPELKGDIRTNMFIGIGIIEALALYAFVISLILLFVAK